MIMSNLDSCRDTWPVCSSTVVGPVAICKPVWDQSLKSAHGGTLWSAEVLQGTGQAPPCSWLVQCRESPTVERCQSHGFVGQIQRLHGPDLVYGPGFWPLLYCFLWQMLKNRTGGCAPDVAVSSLPLVQWFLSLLDWRHLCKHANS